MIYVKITYQCTSSYGTYHLHFMGRSRFKFLARIRAKRYARNWLNSWYCTDNTISYNLVGETISRE